MNIRHIQLLVLDNSDILSKFFDRAAEILDQAQVDMVLLRLDAEARADLVSNRFSAMRYDVFRLAKDTLMRVFPQTNRICEGVMWR